MSEFFGAADHDERPIEEQVFGSTATNAVDPPTQGEYIEQLKLVLRDIFGSRYQPVSEDVFHLVPDSSLQLDSVCLIYRNVLLREQNKVTICLNTVSMNRLMTVGLVNLVDNPNNLRRVKVTLGSVAESELVPSGVISRLPDDINRAHATHSAGGYYNVYAVIPVTVSMNGLQIEDIDNPEQAINVLRRALNESPLIPGEIDVSVDGFDMRMSSSPPVQVGYSLYVDGDQYPRCNTFTVDPSLRELIDITTPINLNPVRSDD